MPQTPERKREYQRELMRRRRAAAKAGKPLKPEAGQKPDASRVEQALAEAQAEIVKLRRRISELEQAAEARPRRQPAKEAEIDPATLSMSAQEKLTTAMRQQQRKLAAGFEQQVLDECRRRMDEISLPHWKRQIDQAQELYARRRALMTKETFNTIRRGLHPDSRQSISDKKLAEAFDAFMRLEKFLLDEKDSPTRWGDLPSSMDEWDKMRAKRPKRTSSPSAVRRR